MIKRLVQKVIFLNPMMITFLIILLLIAPQKHNFPRRKTNVPNHSKIIELQQVSISPRFLHTPPFFERKWFAQLCSSYSYNKCQFHQCFTRAFFVRTSFFLVTFQVWCQISYEKRARKTLMKLMAGVNFTNVFCKRFLYERLFSSLNVTRKRRFYKKHEQKMHVKNVGEIDPKCQFHQHFMSSFFI